MAGQPIRLAKPTLLYLVAVLAVVAGSLAVHTTSDLFGWLEHQSILYRTRQAAALPTPAMEAALERLVVVSITDDTFTTPQLAGFSGPPWPRQVYARVLDELRKAGVNTVVIDVVFSGENQGTAELAAAAKRFGRVVWAADWSNGPPGKINLPLQPLLRAAPWVGITRAPNVGGTMLVDRVDILVEDEQRQVPGLAVETALVAQGYRASSWIREGALWKSGESRIQGDNDGLLRINFAQNAGPKLVPQQLPLEAIYEGVPPSGVLAKALKDKIVLIGDATSLGQDFHSTPLGPMPGVRVQAQAVATVLADEPLREASFWQVVLLTLVLAAIASLVTTRGRWRLVVLGVLGVLGIYGVMACWAFAARQFIMPLTLPAVAAIGSSLLCFTLRANLATQEGVRLKTDLEHFVSPQVSAVGAPQGTVTLVFTDLVDSTGWSMRLGRDFEELRTEYYRLLRDAALRHNGFEVETAGDSLYLVFAEAVDAIQFSLTSHHVLRDHQWPEIVDVMMVRIGVHTGKPFIGMDRQRWTYRGPDTNRAARVMASAGPGQTLTSVATLNACQGKFPDGVWVESAGRFQLKGMGEEELWSVHSQLASMPDLSELQPKSVSSKASSTAAGLFRLPLSGPKQPASQGKPGSQNLAGDLTDTSDTGKEKPVPPK